MRLAARKALDYLRENRYIEASMRQWMASTYRPNPLPFGGNFAPRLVFCIMARCNRLHLNKKDLFHE